MVEQYVCIQNLSKRLAWNLESTLSLRKSSKSKQLIRVLWFAKLAKKVSADKAISPKMTIQYVLGSKPQQKGKFLISQICLL